MASVPADEQTVPPEVQAAFRYLPDEKVVFARRRTSWVATALKIVTLGLYILWWKAAWFVVTDRRLLAKEGIFNKVEVVLPLHFVQDASVHRSWLGVGRVDVSTAGGRAGNLHLGPVRAQDARLLADTIIRQAKRAVPGLSGTGDRVTEDLVRLASLRDSGALTEAEFAEQKARLLKSGQ
jgi:hypothetical protein